MSPTRILYFGSRTWVDVAPSWQLADVQAHTRRHNRPPWWGPLGLAVGRQVVADIAEHGSIIVIEGEADGADILSRIAAEAKGQQVERYPADWQRHGRRAGPLRNEQMAREGRPVKGRCFCTGGVNTPLTRGSAGMLAILDRLGIPTIVHREDGRDR